MIHAAALLMVRTQHPLLCWLYGSVYWSTAYIVALAFYATGNLRAVYVRRSLAAGEQIYGLSDIDFCFVLRDGVSRTVRLALVKWYSKAATWLPILDPHKEFFTTEELRSLNETDPRYHYRFIEGKAAWRRLIGEDVLCELPDFPPMLPASVVSEFNTYVVLLFKFRLSEPQGDALQERRLEYLYLKTILCAFRSLEFLSSGEIVFGRDATVELVRKSSCPSSYGFDAEVVLDFIDFSRRNRFKTLYVDRENLERQVQKLVFHVVEAFRQTALAPPDYGFSRRYREFFGEGLFLPERRPYSVYYVPDITKLFSTSELVARNQQEGRETVVIAGDIAFHVSNDDSGMGYPAFLYCEEPGTERAREQA